MFIFTPADYKLDIEQIVIPPGILPIHEVFFIQNLTTIMPNEKEYKGIHKQSPERYLSHIYVDIYRWICRK